MRLATLLLTCLLALAAPAIAVDWTGTQEYQQLTPQCQQAVRAATVWFYIYGNGGWYRPADHLWVEAFDYELKSLCLACPLLARADRLGLLANQVPKAKVKREWPIPHYEYVSVPAKIPSQEWPYSYVNSIRWLLSNRNPDGGWGPGEYVRGIRIVKSDPASTAGGIILLTRLVANPPEPVKEAVKGAVQYLLNSQDANGGWKNSAWHTEAAVYALLQVLLRQSELGLGQSEVQKIKRAIERGVQWLLNNQNQDGSWYSGIMGSDYSADTQAYILSALIDVYRLADQLGLNVNKNDVLNAIKRGIRWLFNSSDAGIDWVQTGLGKGPAWAYSGAYLQAQGSPETTVTGNVLRLAILKALWFDVGTDVQINTPGGTMKLKDLLTNPNYNIHATIKWLLDQQWTDVNYLFQEGHPEWYGGWPWPARDVTSTVGGASYEPASIWATSYAAQAIEAYLDPATYYDDSPYVPSVGVCDVVGASVTKSYDAGSDQATVTVTLDVWSPNGVSGVTRQVKYGSVTPSQTSSTQVSNYEAEDTYKLTVSGDPTGSITVTLSNGQGFQITRTIPIKDVYLSDVSCQAAQGGLSVRATIESTARGTVTVKVDGGKVDEFDVYSGESRTVQLSLSPRNHRVTVEFEASVGEFWWDRTVKIKSVKTYGIEVKEGGPSVQWARQVWYDKDQGRVLIAVRSSPYEVVVKADVEPQGKRQTVVRRVTADERVRLPGGGEVNVQRVGDYALAWVPESEVRKALDSGGSVTLTLVERLGNVVKEVPFDVRVTRVSWRSGSACVNVFVDGQGMTVEAWTVGLRGNAVRSVGLVGRCVLKGCGDPAYLGDDLLAYYDGSKGTQACGRVVVDESGGRVLVRPLSGASGDVDEDGDGRADYRVRAFYDGADLVLMAVSVDERDRYACELVREPADVGAVSVVGPLVIARLTNGTERAYWVSRDSVTEVVGYSRVDASTTVAVWREDGGIKVAEVTVGGNGTGAVRGPVAEGKGAFLFKDGLVVLVGPNGEIKDVERAAHRNVQLVGSSARAWVTGNRVIVVRDGRVVGLYGLPGSAVDVDDKHGVVLCQVNGELRPVLLTESGTTGPKLSGTSADGMPVSVFEVDGKSLVVVVVGKRLRVFEVPGRPVELRNGVLITSAGRWKVSASGVEEQRQQQSQQQQGGQQGRQAQRGQQQGSQRGGGSQQTGQQQGGQQGQQGGRQQGGQRQGQQQQGGQQAQQQGRQGQQHGQQQQGGQQGQQRQGRRSEQQGAHQGGQQGQRQGRQQGRQAQQLKGARQLPQLWQRGLEIPMLPALVLAVLAVPALRRR